MLHTVWLAHRGRCGYDFDGNADPNKAGEEEWALGFPKLITLFDRIFAHPYF